MITRLLSPSPSITVNQSTDRFARCVFSINQSYSPKTVVVKAFGNARQLSRVPVNR